MNVLLYAKSYPCDNKNDRKRVAEAQLRALRNFARGQGWTVVGEFADKPSGTWDDRQGFLRLLTRAMKGGVQAIVVTRLEQCGFTPKQFVAFADDLHDRGVSVVSLRAGTEMGAPLRACLRSGADLLALGFRISKALGG